MGTSGLHDELASNGLTEGFPIEGESILMPSDEVTVTDWLNKLAREIARVPGAVQAARAALSCIKLRRHKAWSATVRRLVVLSITASVAEERPYASENIFFRKCVSEARLNDLNNTVLQLFIIPTFLDQVGRPAVRFAHKRSQGEGDTEPNG